MNAMVKAGSAQVTHHEAQVVAIVVIPSGGHTAAGEGSKNTQRRTPTARGKEREVRLRMGCYCEAHKPKVLAEVMTPVQVKQWCTRLQMHYGHGALLDREARLEWEPVEGHACQVELEVAPVVDGVRKPRSMGGNVSPKVGTLPGDTL